MNNKGNSDTPSDDELMEELLQDLPIGTKWQLLIRKEDIDKDE